MEVINKRTIRNLIPKRHPFSHKGQNGRVLIVGGSLKFYGAPILSGISAIGGGADLVHLLVPECNFDVSRSYYPDFIVHKYPGNFLNSRALDVALSVGENCDAILLGPGLDSQEEVVRTVTQIAERAHRPIILDADALPALTKMEKRRDMSLTITPHQNEFQTLTGTTLKSDPEMNESAIGSYANDSGVTILLKGAGDLIAAPNRVVSINNTGNAGMTVGGTGDVLAGLVASLIAKRVSPYDACLLAAFIAGAAGDNLAKQKGVGFSATDLALEIPYTLRNL